MPSQNQNQSANTTNGNQSNSSSTTSQGYTAEEKAYVKQQWGSEFHMLRDYGMSIYKEEHREEGRAIVRAFKEQDEMEKEGK